MGRKTRVTPKSEDEVRAQVKAAFLTKLASTCNVSLSAEAVGVERNTVYRWRKEDAQFAADWDDAIYMALEKLEAIAFKRAAEQSDTLMIFLLKAHNPAKYREQYTVKVDDWRSQAIADIKAGLIAYEALANEDRSLADELFALAGLPTRVHDG